MSCMLCKYYKYYPSSRIKNINNTMCNKNHKMFRKRHCDDFEKKINLQFDEKVE